jgi:hypothetical protein
MEAGYGVGHRQTGIQVQAEELSGACGTNSNVIAGVTRKSQIEE